MFSIQGLDSNQFRNIKSRDFELGIHSTDNTTITGLPYLPRYNRLWDFTLRFMQSNNGTTNTIENPNGTFPNTTSNQTTLTNMRNAGMEPICVLYARRDNRYNNTNNSLGGPLLESPNDEHGKSPNTNWSPWQNYVWHIRENYQPTYIKYFEIWNEPNSTSFHPTRNEHQWIECIRQASRFIKEKDIHSFIISGGMPANLEFFKRSQSLGAFDYVDAIGIHYMYQGEDSQYRQKKFKDDIESITSYTGKPIWNTETSIGSNGSDDAGRRQALRNLIDVNKDAGVSKMIYYYLNATNDGINYNLADASGLKPWTDAFHL